MPSLTPRTDPTFLYSDPTNGSLTLRLRPNNTLDASLLDRRNCSNVIDFSIRTHSLDRWVMLRRRWGPLRHYERGSPDSLYRIQLPGHLNQRSSWSVYVTGEGVNARTPIDHHNRTLYPTAT